MPTRTKENYLKAMFFLADEQGAVALADLARALAVSQPTANAMVKKLRDKGWVDYEKYKPLVLTEAGRKLAAGIIRRHRLTEMFLVQQMGFGWEEVHDIAEEIEHIHSERLFDRMDEMLGFPQTDPHGSPIPDKLGNIAVQGFIPLSETAMGTKGILRALANSSHEFLVYLNNRSLELGLEIEVVSVEAFDQSRVVRIPGKGELALSREVCERLLVEAI